MTSYARVALALSIAAATVTTTVASMQSQAGDPGRLYGRVLTLDGEEYVGFLRWDTNEGHWTDHLDATKRLPRRHMREAERLSGDRYEEERAVRVFGIRIGSETNSRWTSSASSVIRFGHIRQIEVLDDDHALLVLKSGEEQELSSSSNDLGSGLVITVEDADQGDVEISWDDLDIVEFLPAPARDARFGGRLHGTLTTRGGEEFTGWITWDRDEIYGVDELDGDVNGRRRAVPFRNIAAIERASSSRAYVTLHNGQELEMSGTNDVNSGNRGIFISDPGLGRVEVTWDEFREVRFHDPVAQNYGVFDGGRRLEGTVYATDGREYSGTIRWDNDEQWTWEGLDGGYQGLEYDVEFGLILSIERVSENTSRVTLRDERVLLMRDSNDVNEDNKGIFIHSEDGEAVMLLWHEFDRVVFR
ncbi:MAG: hypothetical protein O7I93_18320 [Gemmatimonadetes bacterium]|nr:hypothetical protein [Gemmatimonadota bacterium]